MVRQDFPDFWVIKHRPEVLHPTDINTVKSQYWKTCRKRPCHPPHAIVKYLLKPRHAAQRLLRPQSPVIKVTGNDQWCIAGNLAFHQSAQLLHLLAPMGLAQPQMDANHMQLAPQFGRTQYAMQQAPALVAAQRHIHVVMRNNGKFGQHRIAVMPMGVNRISAIGVVTPNRVGKKFVLTGARPLAYAAGMMGMKPQHFLQEHDVGVRGPNGLTQLVEHETAPEMREALMGIDSQDFQREGYGAFRHRHRLEARTDAIANAVPVVATLTTGCRRQWFRRVSFRTWPTGRAHPGLHARYLPHQAPHRPDAA